MQTDVIYDAASCFIPSHVLTASRCTGKERDAESGLDYFGARYYSSSMGRWMSPDPIKMTKDRLADPQQMNLYNYGRNNPLSYIDADGRDINLANDTAEGRAAAQAKLTQGMSKAEAANIGMRQDKSGNWETYVKDAGAVSSKDASVGYKGITGVINDHSVTVSLGLVGGGLTATFGDLGKVSSIGGDQTLGAAGDRNVSVVINQGDAGGCCEVSTPYGRMKGSEPDFVAIFHEVAGETLKYRTGHFSLQINPDLDSRTVINIENKFRNSLGMYPRTGSDHGAASVTVTADGK